MNPWNVGWMDGWMDAVNDESKISQDFDRAPVNKLVHRFRRVKS